MRHGQSEPRRVLIETSLILVVVLAVQLLWKDLGTLVALLAVVYFFVERWLRHRSWSSAGFNFRGVPRALADNVLLIVTVAILIQLVVVVAGKIWFPAYLDHVVARLPFETGQWVAAVPLILIATLLEEITYRAFFQEHLSWFIPTPWAIGVVSIAFGLAHWAPGDPAIIALDLLLVILDATFYGLIFARSKNVVVAWVAHAAADLLALVFLQIL
jgi:membrane protease YdiL (CAAX protease family)